MNTPTSGERAAPFLRDLWVGYARTSPPLDGSWSHCSLCSHRDEAEVPTCYKPFPVCFVPTEHEFTYTVQIMYWKGFPVQSLPLHSPKSRPLLRRAEPQLEMAF